ncbi:PEPxxWA-CTERM sorting domain-containing protein [Sphingomonas sp. MAH-20]|jgi:hypothetical protein|uniref:PEPxxWA-CTERM sorting domain-containing protein n=1 Tax=Sphingomonas horti TaxID=2682842 RepID=A0A6I4J2B4_9SPHN|nr:MULTISPECIES: PEPxxWA-CTERM sorting domain-containing protein [Sphingomonas]MBA2919554.1 PEP-CTERM sorting domain-containing protein [Sphingomonas sp. CGMCC 1.13658]MVO78434.1 PEPxxWA-CTERM sorting domain-containing protein [Sphingomonas horti]
MTKGALLKAVTLSSAMTLSAATSAATLYDQPYDGSGALIASQNDTGGGNGNFATVYDNFTLGGASTVTGVSFTGGYFNPPTVGNITSFTLNFYADNAGQPGSSLATASIPGNGGESCVSTICTYSVAVNFAAAAGTQYWLSIVPDVAFPPQWGWATGSNGDGVAYQDFFGSRSRLTADLAFTLTGNAAVPEPATWALMLGGFGLAGAALRRRRTLSFA